MRSIIQADPSICFLCGGRATETHHIFGGSMRKKSDRLGLVVRLCRPCHNEPPFGVHFNKENMDRLHGIGQIAAMSHYNWTVDEFRREFYKNYL